MDRHIITSVCWFGLIFLSLCLVHPVAGQVDQQSAEAYFKEAATICQRDGGRLWGVSLCGPMVFADARTRTVATNQPRPTGELPRALGLFWLPAPQPNDAPKPTLDFQGYNFWLNKLNQFHGDYIGAEMVKAFIQSTEYRARF